MLRLRQLAERTPPSRERYVDLLRAFAITSVVLGHWLVSVVGLDARGRPTGHSALETVTWVYPVTWLFQVMPLFFVVGGFANAASLNAHRRHGGDSITWLQERGRRLVPPATVLLVTLAVSALLARAAGGPPDLVRLAVWVASIPLWFLSAYLAMILLTPVMYGLHRRFGVRVLPVLVVLVALGDVARFRGADVLAAGGFVFGWLVVYQVGFFWRDGRLPFGPRMWVPLLAGGLAGLLLLTVAGPYPVSMIDVSGQRPQNASPPTLALLCDAAMQLGLVMPLRGPAERWLRRSRPWQAVVGLNAVVFTVFLWHMSAIPLLVGVLDALHALPVPEVATGAWWLWRVPWLAMLTVILAVLVAVFGRVEARSRRHPQRPPGRPHAVVRVAGAPAPRGVLTVAGLLAVVGGLVGDGVAARSGDYLVGMPAWALAAVLLGAAVLAIVTAGTGGPAAVPGPAPAADPRVPSGR